MFLSHTQAPGTHLRSVKSAWHAYIFLSSSSKKRCFFFGSDLAEFQSVASNTNHSGLDLGASQQGVLVRDTAEASRRSIVRATAQNNVLDLGSTLGVAVSSLDGFPGARKDGALDENLGTHSRVDSGVDGVKVVVEDVCHAEAHRRRARVDVDPVVVRVGDVEVSGVLVGIAVAVTDERGLPVVVELGVGDGDPFTGVGDIAETVVVVLWLVLGRCESAKV